MHFELYKDGIGQWRWRLVASGNGKIIAVSSESYHNRQDALHALQLVKQYAATAKIYDHSLGRYLTILDAAA